MALLPIEKAELRTAVVPASTPQMSDPRIIVQTYNPPSKAALPIKLNPPPLKFNFLVPKQDPQIIKNEVHEIGK
jgi:hypothetical protein